MQVVFHNSVPVFSVHPPRITIGNYEKNWSTNKTIYKYNGYKNENYLFYKINFHFSCIEGYLGNGTNCEKNQVIGKSKLKKSSHRKIKIKINLIELKILILTFYAEKKIHHGIQNLWKGDRVNPHPL